MNNIEIILLSILLASLIINFIFIYFYIKNNKNKILGGYNENDFPTKTINNKSNNVKGMDSYCKNLILDISKEFCIECNVENTIAYENNTKLFEKAKNELEIENPSTFKPDAVISVNINGIKKKIIIEFDEGSDFHSDKTNINYVKKYLTYNELLSKDYNDFNPVVFRITYPESQKPNIKYNKYFDNLVKHNIEMIMNDSNVKNCYILTKYKNSYIDAINNKKTRSKNNKIETRIVLKEIILDNMLKSAKELYDYGINYNTIDFNNINTKLVGSFKDTPYNLRDLMIYWLNDMGDWRFIHSIYDGLKQDVEANYYMRYKHYYYEFSKKYYDSYFDEGVTDEFFQEDMDRFSIKFNNSFIKNFNNLPDKESKRIYACLLVLLLIYLNDEHTDEEHIKEVYTKEIKTFIEQNKEYISPELYVGYLYGCDYLYEKDIINDDKIINHLEVNW